MSLTLAITCDVWRKRIWQSLVDPRERSQWWAPGIVLEPETGGRFSEHYTDANGVPQSTEGRVLTCEPNAVLSFTWRENSWRPGQDSTVTFSLTGNEGRTRIELTQAPRSGFSPEEWEAVRTDFGSGWAELLFSLRSFHHRCNSPSLGDIVLEKTIDLPPEEAFAAWTRQERIEEWLCPKANVSPRAGGPFELFWEPDTPEKNSTQRAHFLALEKNREILVQWRGPELHPLMNVPGSTLLQVTFTRKAQKTHVRLVHTGFGVDPAWQAARDWQSMAWKSAFENLD